MSTPTISINIPVDHPKLNQVLALLGAEPVEPPPALEVLERLLSSELNDGEVAFLVELASNAPRMVNWARLRTLAGSGARLGNVTSTLFRRWTSRGGTDDNVPWPESSDGRSMTADIAKLVLSGVGPNC